MPGLVLFNLERINTNLRKFFEITITEKTSDITKDAALPVAQTYLKYMKQYCVDSSRILDGNLNKSLHHYNSQITGSKASSGAKTTRITKELSDLANSLPISPSNAILVRYDSTRMDVFKALIFGSAETPYGHGAFEYDIFIPDNYPNSPPLVNLMTTGSGSVRFNPNLYNCGKVCLSLLGTWRGNANENWKPNMSTILQVLISIQSIIMTEDVYYNEPGFEGSKSTADGKKHNEGYSNIVKYANVRFAMIEAIKNPPVCFKEPVLIHFFLKKDMIMQEVNGWVQEAANTKGVYTGMVQTHNNTHATNFMNNKNAYHQMLKEAANELQLLLDNLNLKVESVFRERSIEWRRKKPKKNLQQALKPGPKMSFVDIKEIDVEYDEKVEHKQIDLNDEKVTNRWSRYIGAMGREAVEKQANSSVMLVGLNAVGVEIAKNIVLSGVKRFTICDGKTVEASDLTGQFFLSKKDIGKNRAEVCVSKLQALNQYVQMDIIKKELQTDFLKSHLANISEYTILVCCEGNIELQVILNDFCRSNNVLFISTVVRGLFSRVFCDFGDQFHVVDKTGEEQRELMIKEVTSGGIVSVLDGIKHGLQDGDIITFTRAEETNEGKSFVNAIFEVTVKDKSSFSIGDVSAYRQFVSGIIKTLKRQEKLTYKSFSDTLEKPPLDASMSIADFYAQPKQTFLHFAFLAIEKYILLNANGSPDDFKHLASVEVANKLSEETSDQLKTHAPETLTAIKDNKDLAECLHWMSKMVMTYNGVFPPLCAFMGGLVAQEVIKGITKKYIPITQYFYYECSELKSDTEKLAQIIVEEDDKYGPLRACIGQELFDKLRDTKLFMVGAGAIGCELLKNYAMLGLGANKGKIVLTDPDVIENSNLNRQFLFREKHLRQPKASTAAAVSVQMNSDLQGKVMPMLEKVHEASEHIFTGQFFEDMDVITNALDNVQARRYIDSRCVKSRTPLLESGTLGPKGHVQVIIPFKTESYGSQQDPQEDNEIPYCTLKMFPEETLHCIEWARDKFNKMFTQKPSSFLKVLESFASNQLEALDEKILREAFRFVNNFSETLEDCVQWALNKYYKLFMHDINQLLYTYPLDFRTQEGQLFWSLPKRPPCPLEYKITNQFHVAFIAACACLRARICGVKISDEARTQDFKVQMAEFASMLVPKAYEISDKKAEELKKQNEKKASSEEEKQPEKEEMAFEEGEEELVMNSPSMTKDKLIEELTMFLKNNDSKAKKLVCMPQEFEKDEDGNFHIDFLHAMTNCRAANYNLEPMDWLTVKLKAGRIIPALATTTAAIAGLQTIELCKLLAKCKVEQHKNSFLNLSLPILAQSEPMAAPEYELRKDLKVNMWDRWDIRLKEEAHVKSLEDLFKHLRKMTGLEPLDLLKGNMPIYVHALMEMPGKVREKKTVLGGMLEDILQREVRYFRLRSINMK